MNKLMLILISLLAIISYSNVGFPNNEFIVKKQLKDTCLLSGHTFKILDQRSGRTLHAAIKNEQIYIINDGIQYFNYRVIYYIFSSVDNSRVPIVRNFDGRVSYPILKQLNDAIVGERYIFEEIIVVDPSGIKLENQVRSILIERVE